MKILALEPYYAGSHQAFLDGLMANSTHDWTLKTLPGYKWKWRMRHSAITFAEMLKDTADSFDLLFCSDMLNLAEFRGLAQQKISSLPSVVYFHENQLTYPSRFPHERDYQFAMTNMTTALCADAVWFNSDFHRAEFLGALKKLLRKMPDYQSLSSVEVIRKKSAVYPPGMDIFPPFSKRHIADKGSPRILWAGRWEHDKNHEDFFAALKILKSRGCNFRLNVLGEQFRDSPKIFDKARTDFADNIDNFGYLPSRVDYEKVLAESDIFVSTAIHEFFGIGFVEAALAGAVPVLPNRLSYPEILKRACGNTVDDEKFLYDGSVADLADKLEVLCRKFRMGNLWNDLPYLPDLLKCYCWDENAKTADDLFEKTI